MSLDPQPFAILASARSINYGRAELPSDHDVKIRDLLLGAASGATFDQLKQAMPRDADRVLGAFAERAASIAVRHQDARELRAGLLAAAIALAMSGDPKEVLPTLALLYRAAEMIGHDPNLEFANANELTGGRAGGLVDFLRRAPEDQTIQAMGYEEGDDKRGFRFLRTW